VSASLSVLQQVSTPLDCLPNHLLASCELASESLCFLCCQHCARRGYKRVVWVPCVSVRWHLCVLCVLNCLPARACQATSSADAMHRDDSYTTHTTHPQHPFKPSLWQSSKQLSTRNAHGCTAHATSMACKRPYIGGFGDAQQVMTCKCSCYHATRSLGSDGSLRRRTSTER
jgi:hypothetical protein